MTSATNANANPNNVAIKTPPMLSSVIPSFSSEFEQPDCRE